MGLKSKFISEFYFSIFIRLKQDSVDFIGTLQKKKTPKFFIEFGV